MKKTIAVLITNILCGGIFAQSQDFEGVIVYKVDVRSKVEGIGDRLWRNMLALGDSVVTSIKKGNYKQTSGISETYFITQDQKAYLKFKGIDTLYFLDYSSDSSTVTDISKLDEKRTIAGHDCKAIRIRTGSSERKYFYSPALYMNPEFDKNNTLGGRYDVFAKETSSLYLAVQEDNESYTLSQTCTALRPGAIHETVFELPKLPQKVFSFGSVSTAAKLAGNPNRWEKYLQSAVNPDIAAKYLKIPKGEETATETVMVAFLINENGKVITGKVLNKTEVHPRLAEEALRVILGSPLWVAATVFNEKTFTWYKQGITFQVSRK